MSILSMGVNYVYRVANEAQKVSILSILSIVSWLLATDWQQLKDWKGDTAAFQPYRVELIVDSSNPKNNHFSRKVEEYGLSRRLFK